MKYLCCRLPSPLAAVGAGGQPKGGFSPFLLTCFSSRPAEIKKSTFFFLPGSYHAQLLPKVVRWFYFWRIPGAATAEGQAGGVMAARWDRCVHRFILAETPRRRRTWGQSGKQGPGGCSGGTENKCQEHLHPHPRGWRCPSGTSAAVAFPQILPNSPQNPSRVQTRDSHPDFLLLSHPTIRLSPAFRGEVFLDTLPRHLLLSCGFQGVPG